MPATAKIARGEIVTMFRTAWLASPYSALTVVYDDNIINPADLPGANQAWARFNVEHTVPGSEAFGDGAKLYDRFAMFTAQLFKPIGVAAYNLDDMAQVVINAFTGNETPNGVWFRNVHLRDGGVSGIAGKASPVWKQAIVSGECCYHEII